MAGEISGLWGSLSQLALVVNLPPSQSTAGPGGEGGVGEGEGPAEVSGQPPCEASLRHSTHHGGGGPGSQ